MNRSELENSYRGRSVLVTGGLGFMGLNLVSALRALGSDVRILSRSALPHVDGAESIVAGAVVTQGDVRDASAVDHALADCEYVFHLAGRSGQVMSNLAPLDDLDVNARGTLTLLMACAERRLSPKFVFPSSRLVYARHLPVPVVESAPLEPGSVYGLHKLMGEHYLSLYGRLRGLRACALRITNPYGPFQRSDQSAYGVINWFIHQAMHDRPLTVYGNGPQIRDYVHIDDVVDAMLLAGSRQAADGKVFNVGGGRGVSFADMAELVVRVVGAGEVQHVDWPTDAADVETGDFVADTSLIAGALDWAPTIGLEAGIKDVVARYRKPASAGS